MIQNIPEPVDFINSGLSLLNFAWEIVASLLTDLDDAEGLGVDVEEVSDAFWQASKQRLTTSLAVAQQGVEFMLKGKIAEISPFLLIAGSPKDWPSSCHKRDISFADFHTIDANDLIKIHNTFSKQRLSDSFISKFEDLRKKRNTIMHTVDRRLDLHVTDVIVEILSVHKHLFPDVNWVRVRRDFLEKAPLTELHSYDYVEPRLIWEFSLITELLKPAHMKGFFDFNKKRRRYICPNCQHESHELELKPKTALLEPNTPDSTSLYCFVCENVIEVERTDCTNEECSGNVVSIEFETCATCGYSVG
jgi:hypothetical protein